MVWLLATPTASKPAKVYVSSLDGCERTTRPALPGQGCPRSVSGHSQLQKAMPDSRRKGAALARTTVGSATSMATSPTIARRGRAPTFRLIQGQHTLLVVSWCPDDRHRKPDGR